MTSLAALALKEVMDGRDKPGHERQAPAMTARGEMR
jgi:hypothetical protein